MANRLTDKLLTVVCRECDSATHTLKEDPATGTIHVGCSRCRYASIGPLARATRSQGPRDAEALTLADIAEKAEGYAAHLASVDGLQGAMRILAQNIRDAASRPSSGTTAPTDLGEIERLMDAFGDAVDSIPICRSDLWMDDRDAKAARSALLSAIHGLIGRR